MTFSRHDCDFADAMGLKLRLNKTARTQESQLRAKYGDLAYEIAKVGVARHLKSGTANKSLTIEHALEMIHEFGG